MGKVAGVFQNKQVDKLMSNEMLAKEARRQIIKFMEETEKSIFAANREIIKDRIPNLNREIFLRFAVQVAEARVDYLRLALDIVEEHGPTTKDLIDQLSELRRNYEELLHAFEETERLIERGYTDIG